MIIKAQQKFIRTSPRKLRLVVDSIKKLKSPQIILNFLQHIDKQAAKTLSKVLKQAIANATNNTNLPTDSLKIKEIQVGTGPTYKRGQPVSRGRSHPIMKRTSHVTVILESKGRKGEKK